MNLELQRSHDLDYLNRMVNHPSIFPFIKDDTVTENVDLSALDTNSNFLLKALADGKEAGFFVLLATDNGIELHSALLPEFRGKTAIDFGNLVISWTAKHTNYDKLTTWAWDFARNVIWAIKKVGVKEESRVDYPNTVNGKNALKINYSINLSNIRN